MFGVSTTPFFVRSKNGEIVVLDTTHAAQRLRREDEKGDNLRYRWRAARIPESNGKSREKSMSVIAVFKYDIKPGRLPDFLKKLAQAAELKFESLVIPRSIRMFRSTVPGPGHGVILMIEYEDMAAYGARTAFENTNAEWRKLFEPTQDSPETLISVELLSEIPPDAAGPASERAPFGFRAP
jgi:hypothetical protein